MSESRLLMSLEADAPSADEIQSRLDQLKQHISNEDYAAATNTFAELTEEYTEKRTIERSKVARARAVRDSAESSFSEQQDATQYIRAATQAASRRTAVHAAVAPLLEQPDEMDSTVAETALDAAVESEESLTTASEQVDSSLSDTTIQPVLTLTQIRATESDSSTDTEFTVEAQVANVGDELAESIVVTVETADSVTLSETETQIAELPAQSQRTVEFAGHASSQGGHDVTVTAESEQAVEVSRTDLIVTGEADNDQIETDDSGDDDGSSSGDGFGTSEMAVVGGGGALALLFGAYALMRRSGDDDGTKSNQTPETPSQHTGGARQGKSSRSTDGPRQGQPSQRTGGTGQGQPSQRTGGQRQDQSSQRTGGSGRGQPSRGTGGTGAGQPPQGSDDGSTKRSTQFCHNCGETLSIEARRCTNCGSDLNPPGT